jgi:hypothetical protein
LKRTGSVHPEVRLRLRARLDEPPPESPQPVRLVPLAESSVDEAPNLVVSLPISGLPGARATFNVRAAAAEYQEYGEVISAVELVEGEYEFEEGPDLDGAYEDAHTEAVHFLKGLRVEAKAVRPPTSSCIRVRVRAGSPRRVRVRRTRAKAATRGDPDSEPPEPDLAARLTPVGGAA